MTDTDRIIEAVWVENEADPLGIGPLHTPITEALVALYEADDPEPPYPSDPDFDTYADMKRNLNAWSNRQALRDAIKEATRG